MPDWQAEIDRWTERFRGEPAPPEPFATALREGWSDSARLALAAAAEAYEVQHAGLTAQLRAAGWDLVRFDADPEGCSRCARYAGCAYTLGADERLPDAPPLPICPACRHTLNLLTPYFMHSMGLDMDDLVAASVPYTAD
ncbi:MAG: hypothetical protein U0Y82_02050 [Thermoleophilia bacterium]